MEHLSDGTGDQPLPKTTQNAPRNKNKLNQFEKQYKKGHITYDKIYDSLEGWLAYAKNANTYKLRKTLLKQIENLNEISTKQINHYLKKTPTPYP
ncbi:hypothetical protein CL616_02745 [archaeon]|nr:hypothetical protein [archaeon]